jgi:2-desacetyl-2-hydroxyethyl bacteriochlorophyllide A dehydrogenase
LPTVHEVKLRSLPILWGPNSSLDFRKACVWSYSYFNHQYDLGINMILVSAQDRKVVNSMRCVVLNEPHQLEMKDVERPRPRPGEALIRIRHLGVCGTDLHAYEGRQPYFTYPRVLGHEIAAEVVDINGDSANWQPGEACVVLPYMACGKCVACRQGKANCCTTLKVLGVHVDGGMQDYLTVPITSLVMADGLTPVQMAMVEHQSIGAHAVSRAQIQGGEWALVVGAGPIGIGVVQFARLAGANLIVMDVDQKRLDFCRQTLSVKHLLNSEDDISGHLAALTGGDYPTVVFEATGNARSMMNAFNYAAHGGRLILVSLVQTDITFYDPNFHKREMTLLSSRNATRTDFERVIKAMRTDQIVTQPLNTHRVSLEEIVREFPGWLKRETGVIKAIVDL